MSCFSIQLYILDLQKKFSNHFDIHNLQKKYFYQIYIVYQQSAISLYFLLLDMDILLYKHLNQLYIHDQLQILLYQTGMDTLQ